ncbi:PEP-CTERM sorting domain-containing protein [Pseudoduganella albidiflava]|uniref:PEP-CTERM sorting domain-containing protein n=1 Tax=Pseudoduganella albidiflava TaxID=321983 RepID=A0A411X1L4_9BURK|nr:PEP-CTERM sorting domain-containing protein [Pseudoduganella albidiflava]QBI02859.1 PEP-CTERM sorting domain-containing protein [Pseudoduganella albidiflava]GGY56915.1 hypothetical protein GCM10007387_44340 [Pseudoduganella albidiflava]
MDYRKGLLAALLVAGTAQALAETHAEASISGLRYTLVDLNSNDGIAPSLNIGYSQRPGRGNISVSVQTLDGTSTGINEPGTGTGPLSYEIDTPFAHAIGSIVGRDSPLTEALSGSVTLKDSGRNDIGMLSDVALESSAFEFTLSANTKVVFSLDAHVAAYTDDPLGEYAASAYAYWFGTMPVSGQIHFEQELLGDRVGHWGVGTHLDLEKTLTLTFANTSGNAAIGSMRYDINTGAIAPIPEPSTYAMMIGGLGLLAFAGRKRKG